MANRSRDLSIVPQPRLLFWCAAAGLPFATLATLFDGATLPSLLLLAALVLAALLDAVLGLTRLPEVRAELPPVLRLSAGRPAAIEVTLHHPAGPPFKCRLGLVLPASLRAAREEELIEVPGDATVSRLAWPCEPARRGRFLVRLARIEFASPLGFWALRQSLPVETEIRVYPNLQRERRSLAALFLNRGNFGLHAQRMVGKGRDFEKLREYIPGDGFDEIHWKATAKRGHPVTKIFQVERTQEIYIVLDASRLSGRLLPSPKAAAPPGSDSSTTPPGHAARGRDSRGQVAGEEGIEAPDGAGETTVLERFITSALVLAQAAEHQGDLFGLITFTDGIRTFLRARNGTQHYSACRDALYTLEAANVAPDFDDIVGFLRTRLRRRALLVFLTSMDDPMLAEGFTRNMALLSGQHLVLAGMIQPPGVAPLFTRGDVNDLDDLYRHLGGHLQFQRLQELQRTLQHRGVRFSLLEQERMAADLVSQYLTVKQRQLL